MRIQMKDDLEEENFSKRFLRKRVIELRKVLQKEPENLEIRLSILRSLLFLQKFDEAHKESLKVLETSPENPIALWVLGNIYFHQKNFEKSEENLKKAVMLLPEFMVAYVSLGVTLLSQNKVEEGVQEINKGIELDPFSWKAHLNLCIAYLMQNQSKDGFDEAKIVWKYHKSFRTLTNLISTYDRVSKLWSAYLAIAFNLLAIIFPSPFTLLLLILGSGRLSISAFGAILYTNKKAGGFVIFVWVISMIIIFILRYNKIV